MSVIRDDQECGGLIRSTAWPIIFRNPLPFRWRYREPGTCRALFASRGALPAAPAGAPGSPGCPRGHAGRSPNPGSSAGKVTLTSYGTGSSAPNPSYRAGGCGASAACGGNW